MSPCYCNFILIVLCLASATSAAKPAINDQARRFTDIQNQARKAVRAGLQPFMWDPKLENYAKSYAGKRRVDCQLVHSGGPYGENIFWGSGGDWTPEQAAADWVNERRWYNYASNSCAKGQQCGHYTQIVWRESTRIGCARVVCDGGKGVFMICNYDPPGNYIGERPY